MTSLSISISGGSPIKIVADSNMSIDAVLSTLPELRGNLDQVLIICNQKVLSKSKTLKEENVKDGAKIFVCPRFIDTKETRNRKRQLTKKIEEIAMEAVRIMDWKINRVLDEPRVMRVFSSYLKNEYSEENQQNDLHLSYISHKRHKSYKNIKSDVISSSPLPMIWEHERPIELIEEGQDPSFQTVSEARKYYSHQLSEHGWDW